MAGASRPASHETLTGQNPKIEQFSAGPFYIAPKIEGNELRVGIYTVERDWLVSELCWIRGLPIPFIKQVQKGQSPMGKFTIVYFLKSHLGVRHVSSDASVCEQLEGFRSRTRPCHAWILPQSGLLTPKTKINPTESACFTERN